MSKQQTTKPLAQIKYLALSGCLLSLVACGGGAGSSQAPDPTISEKPIAYVKRTVPMANNAPDTGDVTNPEAFHPGAHLIVKMTPAIDAPEIDVTNAIIKDKGDVRDPAFSDDGTKLLFALHKEDDNVDPPETWDIYEFDLTKPVGAGNPRPVIADLNIASLGDEIQPQFMPSGRILFSSTRAEKIRGIELSESLNTAGKSFSPTIEATNSNNHAFNLYSMDASGQDIRQITFNMSDDLYPTLMRYNSSLAGRILFTRWEHSPGRNQMSLYTVKPDGTDLQYLYGAHSHDTGTNNSTIQFIQPRETSDGNIVVLAMPFSGTYDGGAPTLINISQYADNTVPVDTNSGLSGPAQAATSNAVVTSAGFSPAGRFGSVAPLLDGTNRALVSYSLCYANVLDTSTNTTQTLACNDPKVDLNNTTTTSEAPPRYGIFIYSMGAGTVLPITPPEPDIYYTDVALVQDKQAVPYIPSQVDESPSAEQTGILEIRSVYDLDGAFDETLLQSTTNLDTYVTNNCVNIDQHACDILKLQYIANPINATGDAATQPNLVLRNPQFLRIVKGVYLPDDTTQDFKTSAFGVNRSQLMRQIIGYTPIDPDGSVRVKVPADVPLSFSIVDRNGRRIGNRRHGFWLSVRPGETLSCNGCHDASSTAPHGRSAAQFPSINPGIAKTGSVFPGTSPPGTFLATAGDTMAYLRSTYGAIKPDGSSEIDPSVDIVFNDIWTDPTQRTVQTVDSPYSYTYASLTTPVPTNGACSPWKYNCRVAINYEADIQPLWSLARTGADGVTNTTCTSCHNLNGAGLVPPTQLDLTNSTSDINGDYFTSYEELLRNDNQVDATGADVLSNPNDATSTITVPHSMSAGSAANSSTFFAKFTAPFPGPTQHCSDDGMGNCVGWLSESELKLLSEWLDAGAQYYNNPFLAPTN